MVRQVLGAALLLGATASAFAQGDPPPAAGRFAIAPGGTGFLRIDTETGKVSRCVKKGDGWDCEWIAGEQEALATRMDALGLIIGGLSDQVHGLSGGLPGLASQVQGLSERVSLLAADVEGLKKAAAAVPPPAASAPPAPPTSPPAPARADARPAETPRPAPRAAQRLTGPLFTMVREIKQAWRK